MSTCRPKRLFPCPGPPDLNFHNKIQFPCPNFAQHGRPVSRFIYRAISSNRVGATKSRRLRLAGHIARLEEDRSAFKMLSDKPTGKRLGGRRRRRWEDNIRDDVIVNFVTLEIGRAHV